ncbi:hypothetical protein DCC78_10745 [bacterium]|nr:MAG: hypothetical protein DCC78_10745 [bacterium]
MDAAVPSARVSGEVVATGLIVPAVGQCARSRAPGQRPVFIPVVRQSNRLGGVDRKPPRLPRVPGGRRCWRRRRGCRWRRRPGRRRRARRGRCCRRGCGLWCGLETIAATAGNHHEGRGGTRD